MKKLVCMFLAFLIVVGLVPSVDASGHGELSGLNNLTSECGIVGNIVKFGKYEQNNVTSDSEEPIEWIVVATEANKSLLLSKYALDYKIYDSYRETS